LRIEAGESVSIQEAVDEQLNSKCQSSASVQCGHKACQSKPRPIETIRS